MPEQLYMVWMGNATLRALDLWSVFVELFFINLLRGFVSQVNNRMRLSFT